MKSFKYFVFLVVISTVLTALPDYIFPFQIANKEFIVGPILEIAYFFLLVKKLKFGRYNFLDRKSRLRLNLIFLPILAAYLFEVFRYFYLPGRNVISIGVNFFNLFIFYLFYISNISYDRDFYARSISIYWKFNYFIAICAVFIFILLHLGVVNLANWNLPFFYDDNFMIKERMYGRNVYSVPYFLTVIMSDYIKPFGFISQFGTFTGLSYEPHVATFFMTPAFFLTFKYHKLTLKNFFKFYFPFILFFLLSFSVTNILALLATAFIAILVRLNIKRLIILSSFSLIGISLIIFNFGFDFLDQFKHFIDFKFNSRSGEESMNFLSYIASPKSILGWGIFNIPSAFNPINANDIGMISALIILSLYLVIIGITVKNFLTRNFIIGLIGVYVCIHSLKFPMHIFLYPYLVFILFLIYSPNILISKKQKI